jgi:hypothetical protein
VRANVGKWQQAIAESFADHDTIVDPSQIEIRIYYVEVPDRSLGVWRRKLHQVLMVEVIIHFYENDAEQVNKIQVSAAEVSFDRAVEVHLTEKGIVTGVKINAIETEFVREPVPASSSTWDYVVPLVAGLIAVLVLIGLHRCTDFFVVLGCSSKSLPVAVCFNQEVALNLNPQLKHPQPKTLLNGHTDVKDALNKPAVGLGQLEGQLKEHAGTSEAIPSGSTTIPASGILRFVSIELADETIPQASVAERYPKPEGEELNKRQWDVTSLRDAMRAEV